MTYLTGLTQGGHVWTPYFVQAIDMTRCLGCGRCLKVCGRNVLHLQAVNEDFEFVDEDEEESERKVMTIAHPEWCIGCQACARICPKNCYTHAPQLVTT
ncbi:MAG: ferredoxin III, nif-specific [Gloeomargarita sp. SKYG116]|nr:ferredoxin III, nif-specific [Gloeomargarita sp. SKYG116]MCS7292703.1 ferredoxin III, nif-specific [Gloeomargarita sp. SKYB120]MDW8178265.1 ferredoxin III, nif-specific [Gloeomargarita sp. SKYBB_i_bin120]MDW8400806.1 ferredoxin III, nif-specific [Gloeomargarita sp. SKYGB_i_bin116]